MKKRIKKYPNIYIALFACLLAAAVGTAVGFTKSNSGVTQESQPYEFTRITVDWSEEEETTPQPATDEANIDVSGVTDERTQTTVQSNKPYSGDFALPMGSDIIKDYSNGEMVLSKTMGDWRVHGGVDFGGSAGNDVFSVADGKITKVYDDSFWGTVVEADYGNGMTVRYCGMKQGTCLPEGTQVEKLEKIGTLGHIPIEIRDEDHLHVEVLIDGENVDPLEALNKVRSDG